MVEKHAVDDSIELLNGIDEPKKRARHEDGELIVNTAPVTEEQYDVQVQDPRTIPPIGGWKFEEGEGPELEKIPLDFDVNGDPQETEAKVWEILRKGSGKESQEEAESSLIAKNASQASAPDRILSRRSNAGTPVANTPPPPSRRSRRSAAQREQVNEVPTTIEELSQVRTGDVQPVDIQPASVSIDLVTLFDKNLTVAIPALTQLVDTAASIPGFLKSEIIRLLQIKIQESQETNGSGSETQDDGYLKTKSQWAFELGKINDDKVISGPQVVESDEEAERVIMMVEAASTEKEGPGYRLERATKQRANDLRSDVRTNPWFNAEGQPFSVVYRMPIHLAADRSSGHTSLATQLTSQEKPIHQQEMDDLREERDRLIRELAISTEDAKSAKEQSTLLKQLYDEASRSNMEAEIESERLNTENIQLKAQVSEGMASVRAFSKARVTDLEYKVRQLTGELHLLTEQNRLTGNEIRRKAALWDAAEAREQERQVELARRQAKRETERRALQAQILGSEVINEPLKKPHELFLEVDLEKEKIDVDAKVEQENIEKMEKAQQTQGDAGAIDDEDELAALQREAAEYGALDTLLDEGDRSRRSRRQRRTPAIPQDGSSKVEQIQSNEELADAINHNQNQALLSASYEVEDQLKFVDQSTKDFSTSNEDQQGLSHVQQ